MATSAAYLYGRRAIDVFVCGICAANALIMLMEVPAFGVGPGLKALLDNLLSLGGNTYGYAAQLEIHEITFLYALFIVYYVFYADRRTPRQRRRNRVLICLSMLFFLSGMKRIMLPALAVSLLYVWLVRKPSHPGRAAIATGIVWFLFFFVYLYAVYTGQLAALRAQYGLQDRLVIGSVARFMPQKNHRRMLQIFARLQAIQPQSSLALIGEGPLMESCRQEPCKRLFPQFATHFFVTRQLYRRSLIEKNHCRFTRHQIGEDALFLVDFYRRSPECLLGVDKPYYHYRCNLSDSASHIFQAERLEDNFYLSDAIAETVREWGLQDSPSHRGAVENRRVLDLQLGIKNVCMSPLAFRQRVAWLRKALKHAGVKQAVGRQPLARVCSRNDRIKLALLKLRCNRAVILLSSLNNRC